MTVLKIELLEPKARALLEDLAKLDLIKIQMVETPQQQFRALLARLRANEAETPSLEEITEEIEVVRTQRQASDG